MQSEEDCPASFMQLAPTITYLLMQVEGKVSLPLTFDVEPMSHIIACHIDKSASLGVRYYIIHLNFHTVSVSVSVFHCVSFSLLFSWQVN